MCVVWQIAMGSAQQISTLNSKVGEGIDSGSDTARRLAEEGRRRALETSQSLPNIVDESVKKLRAVLHDSVRKNHEGFTQAKQSLDDSTSKELFLN